MNKKNLNFSQEKMSQQYVYPKEIAPAELQYEGSVVEISGIKSVSKINSDQQSYVVTSSGKKAVFVLPNTLLTFRDSFVTFNMVGSKTGGTYVQAPKFAAEALFERVRVLSGSKVLMDLDAADVWMSLVRMSSSVSSALYNTSDQPADGTTTASIRTATAAGQKYVLAFPGLDVLNKQFFPNVNEVMPGLLQVELYFSSPDTYLSTDGTNPTYTVSDLHWHMTTFAGLNGGYDQAMSAAVSKGLPLHYRAPEHQAFIISGSGQSQFSLNFRTRRARSIWCVLRTQSRITTLASLNKAASFEGNVSGGFEVSGDCFLRLSTVRYPYDNIEQTTIAVDGTGSKYEALAQTAACFRREFEDNNPRLSLANLDAYFMQQWNSSSASLAGYILGWDLTVGVDDTCYSSGQDLSGNVSQTLSLTLSNVTENIQLDVFCLESKLMVCNNGSVNIYD